MRIIPFTREHYPAAARLAAANHNREHAVVPSLPSRTPEHYLPLLEGISKRGPGVAAVDAKGELIGYTIGMKIANFKGTQTGAYVPEWGSATVGPDRYSLIRDLYASISEQWVQNGCFTHAVTLFVHDREAVDAWFRTGFGMVCGDGVRDLGPVQGRVADKVEVRQATLEDIDLLLPLVHEHQRYYPTAPLFMPLLELDTREHFAEWLQKENHNLWLASAEGELVGYFKSTPSHPGACEMIVDPGTCSICSAFVKPGIRQGGVGAAILSHIIEWARANGYERCAVDYETTNIHGSRFWQKHFTPVSASLFRTVDERAAWAHSKRSPEQIW